MKERQFHQRIFGTSSSNFQKKLLQNPSQFFVYTEAADIYSPNQIRHGEICSKLEQAVIYNNINLTYVAGKEGLQLFCFWRLSYKMFMCELTSCQPIFFMKLSLFKNSRLIRTEILIIIFQRKLKPSTSKRKKRRPIWQLQFLKNTQSFYFPISEFAVF